MSQGLLISRRDLSSILFGKVIDLCVPSLTYRQDADELADWGSGQSRPVSGICDPLPFEMPSRIPLDEVLELYHTHIQQTAAAHMLLPDIWRHASGPDPLLNNLRVIQDNLEQFGTTLQDWLARKMDDRRLALEDMAQLEGLVDDLHDAIATSQMLLDAERGSPKED
ncbi:hypothetical protein EV702DRAFT_1045542 [Suillus placidus]|uniref:Uncharacterized protein n=1 Tax=Suillus placidus TaxID=48579 RepID=A0A9P7D1V3_9AGAM|nr:hypothetical protein EV702DRAFT_1045542 [Suillus placidus]